MAAKEKRKNDNPRRFPWWLLVIGFVLGAAVMFMVMQGRNQPVRNVYLEEMETTGTYIIEQAMTRGTPFVAATLEPGVDSLAATATAIVSWATVRATLSTPPPSP